MKGVRKFITKSVALLAIATVPSLGMASVGDAHEPNYRAQRLQNERGQADHDQEFIETLQLAMAEINSVIPEQVDPVTIIIGNAGVGKTTLFNYLQYDLESRVEGMEVQFRQAGQQELLRGVSGRSVSQTSIPTFSGQYCDCPGFGDSRGPQQSIVNAYAIHRLLKASPGIRILLTTAWTELDNRSVNFLNVVKRLAQIFTQDIEMLDNNVSLVVTKFQEPQMQTSEAITNIKDVLANICRDQREQLSQETLTLLGYFAKYDKNNVLIFRKPAYSREFVDVDGDDRDAILEMLHGSEFIAPNPKIVIDPEASSYLVDFYQRVIVLVDKSLQDISKELYGHVQNFMRANNKSAQEFRQIFKQIGQQLNFVQHGQHANFTETAKDFYNYTQAIFIADKLRESLNYLEFLAEFDIEVPALSESTREVMDTSIERMKTIVSNIEELSTEPTRTTNAGKVTLSGSIVSLRDLGLVPPLTSEINIFSSHSLFFDASINAPGARMTLLAPYWVKTQEVTLNLSGANGQRPKESDPAGYHGQHGGHVYGCFLDLDGDAMLEIVTNGGNGSNGLSGFDGYVGKDGYANHYAYPLSKNKKRNDTWNGVYNVVYNIAIRGQRGTDGSDGGDGGKSGQPGQVEIKARGPLCGIKIVANEGRAGTAGKPGKGGQGGLYPNLIETVTVEEEVWYDNTSGGGITGWFFVTLGIKPAIQGIRVAVTNSEAEATIRKMQEQNSRIVEEQKRADTGKPGQLVAREEISPSFIDKQNKESLFSNVRRPQLTPEEFLKNQIDSAP